jgi:hypothetical protein
MLSHVFGAAMTAITSVVAPIAAIARSSSHARADVERSCGASRRHTAIAVTPIVARRHHTGPRCRACTRERSSTPSTATVPAAVAASSAARPCDRTAAARSAASTRPSCPNRARLASRPYCCVTTCPFACSIATTLSAPTRWPVPTITSAGTSPAISASIFGTQRVFRSTSTRW